MLLVPVVGGLIVGLMARFGSDKIRGHGIPEAIEAILLNGAQVKPSIAVLKPISAAISDRLGRPVRRGRSDHHDRRRVWIAGCAMDAPYRCGADNAAGRRRGGGHVGHIRGSDSGDPAGSRAAAFRVAAARLVPVAFASVTAEVVRIAWLGAGPLFPPCRTCRRIRPLGAVAALPLGLLVGLAAAGLSRMMYGFEDVFEHTAAGSLDVVAGDRRHRCRRWRAVLSARPGRGLRQHRRIAARQCAAGLLIGLVVAKSLMWAFSLGSGTSGGVLAPLLMIGGAMGELAAHAAQACRAGPGAVGRVGMGAMLSGSLGVPLTAILFCLEITHSLPALLPVMAGHAWRPMR